MQTEVCRTDDWVPSSRRPARRAGGRWLAPVAGALVLGGVMLVSEPAHALPGLTLWGSVRGLYGAALGDPALNAYGPGIGLRAGVTLPASLYLGGSFDYFFGESEDSILGDSSVNVSQLMANVGYDLGLPLLTLRPNLGLGLASTSVEVLGASDSESDFVLSPGLEAFVGLGLLNINGELRYNKIFADGDTDAIVVGVGLGISL